MPRTVSSAADAAQGTRRRGLPHPGVYRALFARWGAQHWWPADTPFEVVAGAILTQNTSWSNVERAVRRLQRAGALSVEAVRRTPEARLAAWIRPSGFFRVKARRLKAFVRRLDERYGGSLDTLFRLPTPALREALLATEGIGPETCDSIALYAAGRPVFVADAYTRRVAVRHGWCAPGAGYDELAALFASALPPDARLYNEYHALLVRLGKEHCRAAPRCGGCPLARRLPRGGPHAVPGRPPRRRPARAAAAALLLAAGAAGCATPAPPPGGGPPPAPAAPAWVQARVIRVHPAERYVILECDALPPAGLRVRLLRAGLPCGVLEVTPRRRGAWVVADIVEGYPQPGDMTGLPIGREERP